MCDSLAHKGFDWEYQTICYAASMVGIFCADNAQIEHFESPHCVVLSGGRVWQKDSIRLLRTSASM